MNRRKFFKSILGLAACAVVPFKVKTEPVQDGKIINVSALRMRSKKLVDEMDFVRKSVEEKRIGIKFDYVLYCEKN